MRKPESVKNSETLKKPPGTFVASWWYRSMAHRAKPRIPSSPGHQVALSPSPPVVAGAGVARSAVVSVSEVIA